jgi:Protein of unknown function (DUF4065)
MAFWFNVKKAAQVAAFFALKQGGQIHVLKLTKLVYLSDREFMDRYDIPITGDKLVSMDHGPVNSVIIIISMAPPKAATGTLSWQTERATWWLYRGLSQ